MISQRSISRRQYSQHPISRRQFLGFSSLAPLALGASLAGFGLPKAAHAYRRIGGTVPPLNELAPDFTLPTNTGTGAVSLTDYRGQWVVLYFYPADFTSGCTLEAQRFQRDLPQYLDRNTQILGVSTDDVKSHEDFCDSEGLRFPLLADVTGEVSQAYGSFYAYYCLRHTFIIDPVGVLRAQFLDVNPIIHSQEVLARLDELQA
jgi:peroxiredoxin Q/BCP